MKLYQTSYSNAEITALFGDNSHAKKHFILIKFCKFCWKYFTVVSSWIAITQHNR